MLAVLGDEEEDGVGQQRWRQLRLQLVEAPLPLAVDELAEDEERQAVGDGRGRVPPGRTLPAVPQERLDRSPQRPDADRQAPPIKMTFFVLLQYTHIQPWLLGFFIGIMVIVTVMVMVSG